MWSDRDLYEYDPREAQREREEQLDREAQANVDYYSDGGPFSNLFYPEFEDES